MLIFFKIHRNDFYFSHFLYPFFILSKVRYVKFMILSISCLYSSIFLATELHLAYLILFCELFCLPIINFLILDKLHNCLILCFIDIREHLILRDLYINNHMY